MLTFADLHHAHYNPLSARLAAVFAQHALTLRTMGRYAQFADRYARAAGYLLARAERVA